MCAALGISADMADETPPYARVLAASVRGCELLHNMRQTARKPIIIKPADVKNCGDDCRKLFELGSGAHDLYVLGYAARGERRGGSDWRTSLKSLLKTAEVRHIQNIAIIILIKYSKNSCILTFRSL